MSEKAKSADFYKGVRASIAWLHAEAKTMNDPKAAAILNTAAYGLGVNKPDPNTTPPEPSKDEE